MSTFPEDTSDLPLPTAPRRRWAVLAGAVLILSVPIVIAYLDRWSSLPDRDEIEASLSAEMSKNDAVSRIDASALASPTNKTRLPLEESLPDPLGESPDHCSASALLQAAGVRIDRHGHVKEEAYTCASFGSDSKLEPQAEYLPALRQLDNLREVHLHNLRQPLGREIELIATLPDVRSLKIDYCKFSRPGFAALAGMNRLEELTLQFCELRDGDLEFLRSLPNLRSLHIDFSEGLSTAGLQPLEATSTLRRLVLYRGPATDDTLRRLRQNRQMQTLHIDSTEEITAAGFAAFCDECPLPDLTSFGISHCPASGELLSMLRYTPNLQTLTVDDRGLTVDDYAKLPPLPQLRRLEIITRWGDKPASGEVLRVASHFESLRSFSCDVEAIEPEHLRPLHSLKHLTYLRLNALRLDDEKVVELARLPNLTDLAIGRVDPQRTTARSPRQLKGVKTVEFCLTFDNDDLLPLAGMPDLEEIWSVGGSTEPLSKAVSAAYAARGIAIQSVD